MVENPRTLSIVETSSASAAGRGLGLLGDAIVGGRRYFDDSRTAHAAAGSCPRDSGDGSPIRGWRGRGYQKGHREPGAREVTPDCVCRVDVSAKDVA